MLPQRTRPAGNYLPAFRRDTLLFISGQFPVLDGTLRYTGQVGHDLSVAQGREAAELAALNALAHIRAETDNWRQFRALVRVDGHINSADGWFEQPAVLDGASDLFRNVLGEQAGHARTVLSYSQLPLNAAIELVVIAAIKS